MKKTAIFAFTGNPVCFVHVLLNAIDLHDNGDQVKVVLEGEATKLIVDLCKTEHPLNALYVKVRNLGLIDAVCRACAIKMGALETADTEGFRIADDMAGHAGMLPYFEQGYAIITL
jgi:hypothetical protein